MHGGMIGGFDVGMRRVMASDARSAGGVEVHEIWAFDGWIGEDISHDQLLIVFDQKLVWLHLKRPGIGWNLGVGLGFCRKKRVEGGEAMKVAPVHWFLVFRMDCKIRRPWEWPSGRPDIFL